MVYTAYWVSIYHLPPFKGTRNNHSMNLRYGFPEFCFAADLAWWVATAIWDPGSLNATHWEGNKLSAKMYGWTFWGFVWTKINVYTLAISCFYRSHFGSSVDFFYTKILLILIIFYPMSNLMHVMSSAPLPKLLAISMVLCLWNAGGNWIAWKATSESLRGERASIRIYHKTEMWYVWRFLCFW